MKKKMFLSFLVGGVILVVALASFLIGKGIMPSATLETTFAEDVWRPGSPPNALLDCTHVEKLCISFDKIVVNKTPNDPGVREEWFGIFLVGPGIRFFDKEVKDNIGEGANFQDPGESYSIGKKVCLPSSIKRFNTIVAGYEDDAWPNADDTIPSTLIVTYNMCHEDNIGKLSPTDTNMRNVAESCQWDSDIDRYACHHFSASYE